MWMLTVSLELESSGFNLSLSKKNIFLPFPHSLSHVDFVSLWQLLLKDWTSVDGPQKIIIFDI